MMNWILKCLDEPGRLKTQVWRIIVPKPDSEGRERNSTLKNFRLQWALMNAYERFEQLVVLALSLIIASVILMALLQLCRRVVPLVIGGAIDPLDHDVFQALFGSIFTVLIALEFKHSIVRPALRRNSIVQVRTVLLIALLALSRKFVILDSAATPALTIAALGFATLVLGIVCWLLRERDKDDLRECDKDE
ncbi:Phosphate-starvation-inducible E [compost metagenome]